MFLRFRGGSRVSAAVVALALLAATSTSAFAHARYDHSDPPANAALDGQPFVLRAWFTQELTSKSTIKVVDANGVQVDLADGRVDLDDPDRKAMTVSLPALPVGVYTVQYTSISAEDGDPFDGTFAFGVGMAPPSASDPQTTPTAAPEGSAPPAPSFDY
ncbi:MAG: copper resistance protein CopC [Chloroflexota bacterium]